MYYPILICGDRCNAISAMLSSGIGGEKRDYEWQSFLSAKTTAIHSPFS